MSRTFGDADIKRNYPGIVVSEPEIYKVEGDFDYIILGSDGVFDCMSNQELDRIVYDTLKLGHSSIKQACETII